MGQKARSTGEQHFSEYRSDEELAFQLGARAASWEGSLSFLNGFVPTLNLPSMHLFARPVYDLKDRREPIFNAQYHAFQRPLALTAPNIGL
jgi:hypothetical protein